PMDHPWIDSARRLGICLGKEFEEQGMAFPRFWDSASTIADLCAFSAKRLQLMEADQPYILGLFHDVGIPLMARGFANYMEVLKQANQADTALFTDTEDACYQINHAVIGCVVSNEWGIAESIRNVILSHHDVEAFFHFDESGGRDSRLLALLKIAELGNSKLRTGAADSDWKRFGSQVLDFLGIDEAELGRLFIEFKSQR
ncbi:MAG: HDOD domain-containing protein, partial [Gammaproteobacteria bacterium]|nr:HDOD domain-containing protein [Gammaproteobacteria bacterium]